MNFKILKKTYAGLYISFLALFFFSSFITNFFEGFALLDFKWFKESVAEFEAHHNAGSDTDFPAGSLKSGILELDIKWTSHGLNFTIPSFLGRFEKTITRKFPEYRYWTNPLIPLIPIFLWLLPVYRYFSSEKREYSLQAEKRILNLPMFLFGYTWVFYLYIFSIKLYYSGKYFGDYSAEQFIIFFFSFLISGNKGA